MLEYNVQARRTDAHGSIATAKNAKVLLDTGVAGRPDAFNPAELFLASIAACMIKGIERVTPLLKFDLRGVEVRLRGVRQDSPPKMIAIEYELIVDTDESDRRLELLHTNVRKFGTISNTVADATNLTGRIVRRSAAEAPAGQRSAVGIAGFDAQRLEHHRRRTPAGEGRLEHVGAGENGQPDPVRIDEVRQGDPGQDNQPRKGENSAVEGHGDGSLSNL